MGGASEAGGVCLCVELGGAVERQLITVKSKTVGVLRRRRGRGVGGPLRRS